MRPTLVLFALATVLSAGAKCLGADKDKEAAATATRALAAMVATIETMECKVESKAESKGKSTTTSATYARKLNRDKLVVTGKEGAGLVVAQADGIVRQSSKNGFGFIDPYRANDAMQGFSLLPWKVIGFARYDKAPGVADKADVIEPNLTIERLDRVGGESHRGLRMTMSVRDSGVGQKNVMEYDLDCNALCVLESVEMTYTGSKLTSVTKYGKVKEVQPGIFIPHSVESETTIVEKEKTTVSTTVWTLSDVKVNHKVGDDAVAFTFPKGVTVADRVKGVQYKTGADGKPDGPTTEIPKVAPGGGK